jgi:hypothetical protein
LDFYLTGSVKKGDVESGCSQARTHLEMQSPDPSVSVAEVVRLAHHGCFLEQLVARPVPTYSTFALNGILQDGGKPNGR